MMQRVVDSNMRAMGGPPLAGYVTDRRAAGQSWDKIATRIQLDYMSDGPTGETLRQWFTCPICNAEQQHTATCPHRSDQE